MTLLIAADCGGEYRSHLPIQPYRERATLECQHAPFDHQPQSSHRVRTAIRVPKEWLLEGRLPAAGQQAAQKFFEG